MKDDPVIVLIALLAVIQLLAILNTVMPFGGAGSGFYSVPPEHYMLKDASGEVELLARHLVVYVTGELLHREKIKLACANILILGIVALYRWRKLKKAGQLKGGRPQSIKPAQTHVPIERQ